jgi:hypothetical protein
MAARTPIHDCGPFVCTPQLQLRVFDLCPAALFAPRLRRGLVVHHVAVDRLDAGLELLPQRRGEVSGLGAGFDRLRGPVCPIRSAISREFPDGLQSRTMETDLGSPVRSTRRQECSSCCPWKAEASRRSRRKIAETQWQPLRISSSRWLVVMMMVVS